MIDVIIPCYNSEKTLEKTIKSVINQKNLNKIIIINDKSTDKTLEIAQNLKKEYNIIQIENMYENSGPGKSRNWGALQSNSEYIAFLDSDDEYEKDALEIVGEVLKFKPYLNLLRLELKPVGLEDKYLNHLNFEYAWQHMRMTGAGNTVFRRNFFLACGGFPQDELFRKHGGEDGAFGIATTKITEVGTIFGESGVLYNCFENKHVRKLLDGILFGIKPAEITEEDIKKANKITEKICINYNKLKENMGKEKIGISHLKIEWE